MEIYSKHNYKPYEHPKETLNPPLSKGAVAPRFIPQPSEIEALMKEKLANRKIDDECGWTGEWRMSAKEVLDVILDLQK